MKDRTGFTDDGNWYKGNLHSHTTVSDGMLTPDECVALYRNNGYHFLCLSEHDIYTDFRARFNDEGFIIIPGIECSAILFKDASRDKRARLKIHHIHGILGTGKMQEQAPDGRFEHMQHVPPLVYEGDWPGAAAAQEITYMLRRHGCVAAYNHPVWSRVAGDEFRHTRGLCAFEVFNFNTVQESGTGYNVSHWDAMLRAGARINAFASDDNHNEGLFEDSCGGWISLRARELAHDAVIEALISGNYYSSSGPKILSWGVRDSVAYVECSAVNRVNFVCGNYINDGLTALGEPCEDTLTRAECRLKGHETYLRIECVDKYGRTAWTNPTYFK